MKGMSLIVNSRISITVGPFPVPVFLGNSIRDPWQKVHRQKSSEDGHAGATNNKRSSCTAHIISIHAPVRGATHRLTCRISCRLFQSTPPVRGATCTVTRFNAVDAISIHAPRAGGDGWTLNAIAAILDFNPRPPCGGRRGFVTPPFKILSFQSTPPVRGATRHWSVQNPCNEISIHAPRAGGDILAGM